ncbi:hypothetical protein [Shewanella saliphila]|uniref:Uncharacterized protein n=1 Tax=Shewanella saliphila TaxID=2282698 RepID=A0ABQ2Q4J2_9GAMM|nr:hypothetical protein [Shewanella saliphila]MCL1101346.1 hypothetical protein [Shewanella saliphila]GGP50278.1 hypothetical protein GCM10009409_15960 [Shewanella saliphila]
MLKKLEKKLKQQINPTASIEDYQYHIDIVSPELITGWAVNKVAGAAKPKVEVFSGSTLLWQSDATFPREDLQAAGFGDAAFNIVPDASVLTDDINAVDIFIDGHKANATPFALVLTAPKAEDYTCHVDAIDNGVIIGWAKHLTKDTHRVNIEVKHNDVVISAGLAADFREDLQQAEIGDGQYGFKLGLNLAAFPSDVVSCQVYVDGLLTPIAPFEIKVAANDIEKAKFLAQFADQLDDFQSILAKETQRINQQIEDATPANEETTLNTVAQVAINNIAEISARLNVIETVMVKHLK